MIIELNDLSHIYNMKQINELYALKDINLSISSDSFTGIIGHTGSGKSTLVQHLNGLLKPSMGKVLVDGIDINEKTETAKKKRQQIGLVFQYPEHQLFEETIFQDISFGPKNQGLKGDELKSRVEESMLNVGLDLDMGEKSPFEVSGGQRRRVAIAGVIAMKPEILILDEPTAGLDPKGRDEILSYISSLHEKGVGIIFISHSMEDTARLCDDIIVMDKGKLIKKAEPREIFSNQEELTSLGLDIPQITQFMIELSKKYPEIRTDILNVEEAREEINRVLGGRNA